MNRESDDELKYSNDVSYMSNDGVGHENGDHLEHTSGGDHADPHSHKNEDDSEYEDVCFICRRPESKAGRMFHLPNHITVCDDCMHKTMDAVSQMDYPGMMNPNMMNPGNMNPSGLNGMQGMGMISKDELEKLKTSFPNISFMNMNDFSW